MLSRRHVLKLLGGASLGVAGGLLNTGCTITQGTPPISEAGLDKKPAPGRKTNIEVYSLWGASVGQGLVELSRRFEEAHPDIGVRVTYAPTITSSSGAVQQKLMVAIAGGNPPDVAQLVPSQTPQWAELGMMQDLTSRFNDAGHSGDDFFGPAWESMQYNGSVWQMQWDADPNFPFFWNKQIFEDAGLDPDRQPETFEEVDEYSAKILQKKGGTIERVGTVPWDWYGHTNSMFTVGWAFGGSFYDGDADEVTPDHPQNIEALEWMVQYAQNAGGAERVPSVVPGVTEHRFTTGRYGFEPLVAPNYTQVLALEPEWGIGAGELPNGPKGEGLGAGAWFGGWGMFVPRGAREPDAAFEFINWVSTSDEGTSLQWELVGFPPAYQRSPVVDLMGKDEMWQPYHKVLTTATNARPPMTVSDFYFQVMDAEVWSAVLGAKSAADALTTVKRKTNEEIERFKKEVMV